MYTVSDPDPDILVALQLNPDPGCCWIRIKFRTWPRPCRFFLLTKKFFLTKTHHICFLHPYKGHSGSWRSLQPSRELFKPEISSSWITDPGIKKGTGSGSVTLLYGTKLTGGALLHPKYSIGLLSRIWIRLCIQETNAFRSGKMACANNSRGVYGMGTCVWAQNSAYGVLNVATTGYPVPLTGNLPIFSSTFVLFFTF